MQTDVQFIARSQRRQPLWHSHACRAIASGLDVMTMSGAVGARQMVVTLTKYAHLFHKFDTAAASALEAAMPTGPEH